MNQKEEERLIIEYFRKNFPDFPRGKLVQNESPDFIFRQRTKQSIGIELTRLAETADNLYDNISTSITKKNEKLSLYQNYKLSEQWLIIYTDDMTSMYSENYKNIVMTRTFYSGFTRIYLFDLFEKNIYQLLIG